MSWVQRWAAWNKIHDRAVYKSASPHLQTQDESFKSHVHLSSRGELPVVLERDTALRSQDLCDLCHFWQGYYLFFLSFFN